MYEVISTNRFSKDYKQCKKRQYDILLLNNIIRALAETGTVPVNHKPHILSGKLVGYWECHVKTDWLLIWLKNEDQKTITLIGTGTHSDLF
jgi:mRNA interferase YafQ